MLGNKHLVLTHIGGDIGIAVGNAMQRLHDLLRLDNTIGMRRDTQGIFFAPFAYLLPPGRKRLVIDPLLHGV